jgi:hypothetical protein
VTAKALGREEPWFQAVSFHAVLAALCPLVPLPLVDDILVGKVKKHMTRGLAQELGVPLGEPQIAVLAGAVDLEPGGALLRGCLGASVKLGLALLKALFSKLVFVLAFKKSVELAEEVFREGVLLHHAFTTHRALLPEKGVDDPLQARARHLRKAIDLALDAVPAGAVRLVVDGVFRGARNALVEGARVLAAAGRDEDALPVADEARVLESVTNRLRDALWAEQETIVRLRGALDASLDTPGTDH